MQKIKAVGLGRQSFASYGAALLFELPSSNDIPWTSGSGYGEDYTCHVKLKEPLRFHLIEDLSEYAELEDY